jgi:hypothetical protein
MHVQLIMPQRLHLLFKLLAWALAAYSLKMFL